MKGRIITLGLVIGFSLGTIKVSYAQESEKKKDKRIYLELRPLQFALDGYSFVGHYAINERMQIGFNVFAATLSDGITDFVWDIQGEIDLEAEQDLVLAFSYRYFLNKNTPHRGLFAGAALGVEDYTLTDRNINQERDYQFWYVAPRIGYLWHPFFKSGSSISNLFIALEAVAVFPIIRDDEVTFDSGSSADINSILPSPLIGIGFRF